MSLDELQEQVERIYVDIENELLLNIAKKLSTGKPMEIDKWDEETGQPIYGSGGVNEWQLQRLKELNGLNEENAKIIAKYSGKTVEEVNKVFDRAKEIGMTRDEATIEKGIQLGILNQIDPVIEKPIVQGILTTAIQEVLTTFNKQNNSLLASAGSEYVDIVNKVSSQVLAGTKTTNKAMQEAVSQLAEKGLTGFTARNGAQWTPEAYTKMLLRANTQNTINSIQEERVQACGGDFVEISSHVGARPLCSQDQGQVFSLSGYSGYIEDLYGGKVKVRPWSSSTYGEPAGILGINCGHSKYMFVPGLSKKREMDFTKAENDEAYIEKQRQRQYERTIRNKKREIAMLKQTGAEDGYIKRKQNSLSNTRKEYLSFLNKTGRTRVTANEWIGSSTISPKSTKSKPTAKKIDKIIPMYQMESHKKYMSDKEIKTTAKEMNNIISKHTNIGSKWSKKIVIDNNKNPGKLWSCDIRMDNNTLEQELSHELLHARSISYFDKNIFLKYTYEEEATVEMFNKQILVKEKIPYYNNGYSNMVDCLEEISDIMGIDRYKFAKELFNVKVTEREKWLKQQIKNNPEKDKLEELMKEAFVKW